MRCSPTSCPTWSSCGEHGRSSSRRLPCCGTSRRCGSTPRRTTVSCPPAHGHRRAAAGRPVHRQAVRLRRRGRDGAPPRPCTWWRDGRRRRPLRGDPPEVIEVPRWPRCSPKLDQIDPAEAWQPWRPSRRRPWGRKWAAHLYRRAGFGPSRDDLAEAERLGPEGTLDLLLRGRPDAAGARGDAERRRPDRRRDRRSRRSAPRLVAVLHAPGRPPAAREDDAVLAQPLRHQHRQGARTRS